MAFNNNFYHLHVSKGGGGVYSVKRSMFNSILLRFITRGLHMQF